MSIRIDQGDVGPAGESRDNLAAGNFTATWTGAPGAAYLWTMAVSEGCTATLVNPTAITCGVNGIATRDTVSLFLDIDGVPASYTAEFGGRSTSQGGAAVLDANGLRFPAKGERGQFPTTGWGAKLVGWLGLLLSTVADVATNAAGVAANAVNIAANAAAVTVLQATSPTADEKTSLGNLDGADQGTVFYAAASGRAVRLAPGAAGQVLQTGGPAADPSWVAPSGGVTDHGALTGLGDNDHPQYEIAANKGAANGYAGLNAGSEIADATHGTRAGGTLHAAATTGVAGFMSAADKTAHDAVVADAVRDGDFAGAELGALERTGTGPATYIVLKHNRLGTVAPAVTDDDTQGYAVGSHWIDVVADNVYACVDASTGAAVWRQLDGGSSGLTLPGTTTDSAVAAWVGTDGDELRDSLMTVGNTTGNVTVAGTQRRIGRDADDYTNWGTDSLWEIVVAGTGRFRATAFSNFSMQDLIPLSNAYNLGTLTSNRWWNNLLMGGYIRHARDGRPRDAWHWARAAVPIRRRRDHSTAIRGRQRNPLQPRHDDRIGASPWQHEASRFRRRRSARSSACSCATPPTGRRSSKRTWPRRRAGCSTSDGSTSRRPRSPRRSAARW